MSTILYNGEPTAQQLQNCNYDDYGNTDCEDVLEKMAAIDLNGVKRTTSRQQSNCDGSDSGVDIAITNIQREPSHSSGFNIANGGMELAHELNMSCNSSLISCGSDLYEAKTMSSSKQHLHGTRSINSYEYCSDNGSESSSVQGITATIPNVGAAAIQTRRTNNVKKKVAMFEPTLKGTKEKDTSKTMATPSRPRAGSQLQRAVSLPRSSQPSALRLPRERLQEKPSVASAKNTIATTTAAAGVIGPRNSISTNTPKPQKPDSLPNPLNRKHSISMQRLVQRTPSLSRARTPGTPSDDGRWPAVTQSRSTAVRRGMSVTPDLSSLKMRTGMLATTIEQKSSNQCSVNPYSTLPRRRKQQSVEDLTSVRGSRSSSITRESRMTSSVILTGRKNLLGAYGNNTHHTPAKTTSAARRAPSQTPQPRTRIYHEISVQTALTNDDIERAFAGSLCVVPAIDLIEKLDQQTQTDIRDREVERLQDEVRQLKQREHDLSAKLQREREEKLTMQRELTLNTDRVICMLEMARIIGASAGTPTSEDGESHDSLLMLESQIQLSGHELIERHKEIGELRKLCMTLQVEMERSLTAQKNLLEEKSAIEQESNELQDFLQHEKAAMCDALKELELEYQSCKQVLCSRDEEVKVLRDECRHLVRLNEQRRQENRMLQTKYSALEAKSKELILQQNASVTGASAALSGLHTRLDNLVEQLVFSYNISENDLEDTGFHNEASHSNGIDADVNGCESQTHRTNAIPNSLDLTASTQQQTAANNLPPQLPSDGSLSPQRNQSFIAAVISAIRHATTTHSGKRLRNNATSNSSANKRNAAVAGGVHNNNNNNSSNNSNNNNNSQNNYQEQSAANTINGGDDSDSTEMLDSETEPCLMMDNVLEDVVQPDSHSHNMVSSCMGIVAQIDVPSDLGYAVNGDNSLHNLSQAITNRQQLELEINALTTQKTNIQLIARESSISEDITSCHDSLAEMPSLIEYSTTQAVVDQVIEVDTLITKLLKVLRLIQLDNDNCIQQLIVDKNKLQQHKEDMLEKIKDLQDVNVKLQDELMDATQELLLKNNDLSSTKAEMQRHRNEIDRLTEDICTLSTLCSNYKKLSPQTEFPPMLMSSLHSQNSEQAKGLTMPTTDDASGIINLLKLWHTEGQLSDVRVIAFLQKLLPQADPQQHSESSGESITKNNNNNNNERLLIYANQLENIINILNAHNELEEQHPAIKEMRQDIETVRLNANWLDFIPTTIATATATTTANVAETPCADINANMNLDKL